MCIDGLPRTEWAREAGIVRDQAGYLVTGPDFGQESKLHLFIAIMRVMFLAQPCNMLAAWTSKELARNLL